MNRFREIQFIHRTWVEKSTKLIKFNISSISFLKPDALLQLVKQLLGLGLHHLDLCKLLVLNSEISHYFHLIHLTAIDRFQFLQSQLVL